MKKSITQLKREKREAKRGTQHKQGGHGGFVPPLASALVRRQLREVAAIKMAAIPPEARQFTEEQYRAIGNRRGKSTFAADAIALSQATPGLQKPLADSAGTDENSVAPVAPSTSTSESPT